MPDPMFLIVSTRPRQAERVLNGRDGGPLLGRWERGAERCGNSMMFGNIIFELIGNRTRLSTRDSCYVLSQ